MDIYMEINAYLHILQKKNTITRAAQYIGEHINISFFTNN